MSGRGILRLVPLTKAEQAEIRAFVAYHPVESEDDILSMICANTALAKVATGVEIRNQIRKMQRLIAQTDKVRGRLLSRLLKDRLGLVPVHARLALALNLTGHTAKQLADDLGVTERRLTYWRRRSRTLPPVDVAMRIATHFDLTTDEFWG